MIPEFNEHGYLPAGIHAATLEEIDERFGTGSEIRQVQFESFRWLVETALRADVKRILLNGSFVTDVAEPNDVDCVLLIDESFPHDSEAGRELREGLPFLDVELTDAQTLVFYVNRLYATDRLHVPKGLIEVLI